MRPSQQDVAPYEKWVEWGLRGIGTRDLRIVAGFLTNDKIFCTNMNLNITLVKINYTIMKFNFTLYTDEIYETENQLFFFRI